MSSNLNEFITTNTSSLEEYNSLTRLAALISGTKISLITVIDEEGQQSLKTTFGLPTDETMQNTPFCRYTIEHSDGIFIVEDATKDDRFKENLLVKGEPNMVFYAGVPILDKKNNVQGTICVIDNAPKKLSLDQIDSLKTLSKSVMNLFELNLQRIRQGQMSNELNDILEFTSRHYLIIDEHQIIKRISSNFSKVMPNIKIGDIFSDYFEFSSPFRFCDFIDSSEQQTNLLRFFISTDRKQRYKFSAKKVSGSILLVVSPVINHSFPISNYYNLSLNDFTPQDYISEYLFLQQLTDSSLSEARNNNIKLSKKNQELIITQNQLSITARFPSENPNPIIRLDYDLLVLYQNDSAKENFSPDFSIKYDYLTDSDLTTSVKDFISSNEKLKYINIVRYERIYRIALCNIFEHNYINIYVNDLTYYINQITERENEISKIRNFYELILNKIPVDIAVFDLNHKYVFLNPAAISDSNLRGYLIGKDDYDYCSYRGRDPKLADDRRAKFNRVLVEKKSLQWVDKTVNSKGELHHVLRKLHPIFIGDEMINVIGFGTDVTELKKQQDKISDLNNSLELKVLERTNQLLQKNDELEKFSYSVSHDLRSPLRMINQYATLLKKNIGKQIPEPNLEMIIQIKNYTIRMDAIINDLLNLAKIGTQELKMSTFDLGTLTKIIVSELESDYNSGSHFSIENLENVNADQGLIRLVLTNLISNAIKYSSKKIEPLITIGKTISDTGELIYYIKDNGVGFEPAYAEKLFTPFNRLHSDEEFHGTGLGLYIVRSIISKHKGKIWAEGIPNKGSTFYFTLPAK
jgi:signal transduction histidine kinase